MGYGNGAWVKFLDELSKDKPNKVRAWEYFSQAEKINRELAMERFDDEDQDYIDMHGKPEGYHTRHLFRCQPSSGAKQIEIRATNRFGETYKQTVVL